MTELTKEVYRLLATSLADENTRHESIVSALKAGMKHKHFYKPFGKEGVMAVCEICDKIANNWYCPNSPDHICHYSSTSEYDECMHCGRPEERK